MGKVRARIVRELHSMQLTDQQMQQGDPSESLGEGSAGNTHRDLVKNRRVVRTRSSDDHLLCGMYHRYNLQS